MLMFDSLAVDVDTELEGFAFSQKEGIAFLGVPYSHVFPLTYFLPSLPLSDLFLSVS